MQAIRRMITSQALAPGDKLPSIRRFARDKGVSPSTVVEAYDRLAAEGLIRPRPGSGFYVAALLDPTDSSAARESTDRAVDPFWVSRQSLDAGRETPRPGCGWLPPDWMPLAAVRRAIRAAAKMDDATLVEYGSTHGSLALRRMLVRQFASEGIEADAGQILLTSSGTQAIDLICRHLLRPGDTVLIDDPCYFNFRALLQAHAVRIVGVPYTQTGPDIALFQDALATHKPRLYLTNSALHNPTGVTLSPKVAHRILSAAASHDLMIVEDEIFADFEPDRSVRLAALDGLGRVIRIGSFSKTLSASIRCGYIAASPELVEALVDLQLATGFGGPSPLAAELVLRTLSDGSYYRHLGSLRSRLARRRREIVADLAKLGVHPWTLPRGGFYLWCRLPDAADASEVARRALRDGIVLAPGNVFSVAQTAADFMRFNVAQMNADVLRQLQKAMDQVLTGSE
ncbi:DNA-binding transcriptional regulator, MocR family, contains an aminotransferase domain [Pseudoxanthobacter soli DSM 19599]|uniref:DNA-binding transcriptional regulator, MocR family, contains an aminotransferase domain n=1 Tax=Pseudoxanthobacter soli DSM 19599 TaxID=1123029 RepID=A0A1M7ZLZ6_9HYPH|nr:PLP-dependent aminotransferase family protein [Pseudoxanthobacter soli]SHO65918.1 DNA-binding transcriptional regulator, MocR family, contains an aminotransferase domain [Pseudoxanthobacter soli DSM 19599]